MFRSSCYFVAAFLLFTNALVAQETCPQNALISAASIVENTKALCCARTGKRQKACFTRGIKRVRRTRAVISRSVVRAALGELREYRRNGCGLLSDIGECTDALSVTNEETVNAISKRSCGFTLKSDRQKKLKKYRRVVRRARIYLGKEYIDDVRSTVADLLDSPACGAGGEEVTNGCARIVDPRDGGNSGNVYKLSDHSPNYPVFVTHNGSRAGTAITPAGELLDTLRYTGLANPDPAGLRHHYRFNRSCGSLPAGYYLKLGGTCYEIDSPCSRID